MVNLNRFRKAIFSHLQGSRKICITSHIHPDGDSIGACLALKVILTQLGFQADYQIDEKHLERYDYLELSKHTDAIDSNQKYDVLFILDLHEKERLGKRSYLLDSADSIILIDHHETANDVIQSEISWIDTAAVCTGWMIYQTFKQEITSFDDHTKKYLADCFYTALISDTNNFTNANTNGEAFEMSATLISYGLNPQVIYKNYMQLSGPEELRMRGMVFSTIETFDQGSILFMHCQKEFLQQNNLTPDATSNLTNHIQNLKGVDTAVFFREIEHNLYRLSFRSQRIDVNAIASYYGGGGHLLASGCVCQGNIADIKIDVLERIRNSPNLKPR